MKVDKLQICLSVVVYLCFVHETDTDTVKTEKR